MSKDIIGVCFENASEYRASDPAMLFRWAKKNLCAYQTTDRRD
jgi:hypothetical protein